MISYRKLSYYQRDFVSKLQEGLEVFVFEVDGMFVYGYDKYETSNRLYVTRTCRSLYKQEIITHEKMNDPKAPNLVGKVILKQEELF